MEKLLEKYVENETKIATINGLLLAEVICARKLHEVYSREILDVMGSITEAIEGIKNA